MGFWTTSDYTYQSICDLPNDNLISLVNAFSRKDIIEWLMWNDPNGIYSGELSLMEFGSIMKKEEGLEILIRQIEENRPEPSK